MFKELLCLMMMFPTMCNYFLMDKLVQRSQQGLGQGVRVLAGVGQPTVKWARE